MKSLLIALAALIVLSIGCLKEKPAYDQELTDYQFYCQHYYCE